VTRRKKPGLTRERLLAITTWGDARPDESEVMASELLDVRKKTISSCPKNHSPDGPPPRWCPLPITLVKYETVVAR